MSDKPWQEIYEDHATFNEWILTIRALWDERQHVCLIQYIPSLKKGHVGNGSGSIRRTVTEQVFIEHKGYAEAIRRVQKEIPGAVNEWKSTWQPLSTPTIDVETFMKD